MPPTFVFAQAAEGGGSSSLIFLAVMLVAFWFLFIRPQRKRQAQLKEVQETLTIGTEVRTIGGIMGRVLEIEDNSIVIEVESGRLRVSRQAVAGTTADLDA